MRKLDRLSRSLKGSYRRTPEITTAFKDFVVERDGFEPSVRTAMEIHTDGSNPSRSASNYELI